MLAASPLGTTRASPLRPRSHFGTQIPPLSSSEAAERERSPRTPAARPRPFVWGARGRGLRGLGRPRPEAPRRRLEPRTAPPVPGLRESYRGELARYQNPDPSYPPRECLSPAADSPSPNGFPGAHCSQHLRCRFTKWPPARSAASRSQGGRSAATTSSSGRRRRAEGLRRGEKNLGSCRYLW